MLIRPSSTSWRLIHLACVGERPRDSCCIRAEGHTIGRDVPCQSCGWVKRKSQSTACTSRGEMPISGAASLIAASNCPGTSTPGGSPAKASAVRSVLSRFGDQRRKPVGGRVKLLCGALGALSYVSIVILLLG